MDQYTQVSAFLNSRRARLRPEEVGLPARPGGRRRVPGLRREELAHLAGVSPAYYARLEQGRARNVSDAVLDAIARALRLTPAEHEHLIHLARPSDGPGDVADETEEVRRPVRLLLDRFEHNPAFVLGRRLDVLATNRLANLLLADFPGVPETERNLAWQIFLNPAMRRLYRDWRCAAVDAVGFLRISTGAYPRDTRLTSLVCELTRRTPEFEQLWSAHHVHRKEHGVRVLDHPRVGTLTLMHEAFVLPGDPGQRMVTYQAEPGSASDQALRALAGR